MKNRGIGIQFVDTQKGKVIWEDYDQFDITYTIEGSYITFNDIAFQLAGAPWVIKSCTKNHITLIQNEVINEDTTYFAYYRKIQLNTRK